jgi:hypothetical protein
MPHARLAAMLARLVRENSLSLALFGIFFLTVIGQVVSGLGAYNQEQRLHEENTIEVAEYLTTGHFLEALFENFESEFLQMAAFVVFTIGLRQKGSAESKKLDVEEPVDRDPRAARHKQDVPWPVKKGGVVLKLYENSLSLVFVVLFVASFALHAVYGASDFNDEQREHGQSEMVSAMQYMVHPRFWFESFQNWQSEFMSLGAMVVLSIFLRQRGSPESKPVDAPHGETEE